MTARLLLFVGFLPLTLFAQWIPITAKTRIVHERIAPDGTVERKSFEGRFLRWADGTQLHLPAELRDGAPNDRQQGTYIDSTQGYIMDVELKTRVATIRQRFTPPRVPVPQHASTRPLKTVNGIECISIPIYGDNFISAEGCYSKVHDIVLKQDITRRHGSYIMHTVEEIYDLKVGESPSEQDRLDLRQFFVETRSSENLGGCPTCTGIKRQ